MNDRIAENIDINMAAVADFCHRWHINEMALFGSVLRDDLAGSDFEAVAEAAEAAQQRKRRKLGSSCVAAAIAIGVLLVWGLAGCAQETEAPEATRPPRTWATTATTAPREPVSPSTWLSEAKAAGTQIASTIVSRHQASGLSQEYWVGQGVSRSQQRSADRQTAGWECATAYAKALGAGLAGGTAVDQRNWEGVCESSASSRLTALGY